MDIKKLIPFLGEEELEGLAYKIEETPDGNYQGITLNSILPFLDDDFIGEIAKKRVASGKSIKALLPFIDDDTIDEIFLDAVRKGSEESSSFLPFVSDEGIMEAVKIIKNGETTLGESFIDSLFPFMDDDDIDDMFINAVEKKEPYAKYLPYVSDDAMHIVVEKVLKGECDVDLDSMVQFMDEDDVRALFRYELNKKK